MNRKQMRLLRFLFIILLLLLAVFLVLSSDRFHSLPYSEGPIPNTEHSPTEDPEQFEQNEPSSESTDPDLTPTSAPPAAKPADLFDVTGSNPHTTLFHIVRTGSTITTEEINYSNYLNGVKTLYLDDSEITFSDQGYYTVTGADRIPHTYRISDYVDLTEHFSGLSSATEGSWFFLGALETKDYIYVAYDFWSVDELTLFFRMDKTGHDAVLVYATHYNEKQNEGVFTASNEYIFYIYNTYDTQTGAIESSLMQAETDGSRSGILLPLSDGYSAHHLTLADNALLFFVTDPQGTTALVRMDTLTQELTYVTEKSRATDYLFLYQNFAIVGKSGSSLVLYNLNTCEEILIPLGDAATRSLGFPVCNRSQAYLQYFNWNASSDTVLLKLDIHAGIATPVVLQQKNLCYVTGITDDFLYAESDGSYIRFPLP